MQIAVKYRFLESLLSLFLSNCLLSLDNDRPLPGERGLCWPANQALTRHGPCFRPSSSSVSLHANSLWEIKCKTRPASAWDRFQEVDLKSTRGGLSPNYFVRSEKVGTFSPDLDRQFVKFAYSSLCWLGCSEVESQFSAHSTPKPRWVGIYLVQRHGPCAS